MEHMGTSQAQQAGCKWAGIANSEQDLVFVVKLHTDNFKSLVDASTVAGIHSRLGL